MQEVENIVEKGGIGHHEEFLLLSQCFQKSSASETSESVCMLERVILNFCIDNFSHEHSPEAAEMVKKEDPDHFMRRAD